jgi:hypothetical protein
MEETEKRRKGMAKINEVDDKLAKTIALITFFGVFIATYTLV